MVFRWRRAEEPSRPIRNCYWVETERLLAGGYPCLRGEDASRKVLRKFLDQGIRQFIDLTEEGELPCYRGLLLEEAAERGETVTWERFPIVDMDVPRSKPQPHWLPGCKPRSSVCSSRTSTSSIFRTFR